MLRVWVDDLGGTKTHCFVRLTHKHAMTIRLGEKRDGAQRCAMFLIEVARRMDEAHSGFTAIYYGHALKFMWHNASNLQTVKVQEVAIPTLRRPAVPLNGSVSRTLGSATVR